MAKAKKKSRATALARRPSEAVAIPADTTPMGIMARMARDPKLTVEKLGELIKLNERIADRQARMDFDAAYDAMVLELPVITKRGKILNKEKQIQSHYARFEDIQRIVKPILKRFGFTLSYRTEWPDGLICEVVGVLTHRGGHSRESRFRSTRDASGGKNEIQGLGSANAYGRRYTTIDLLNIVCEGVDDDGQKAGRGPAPRPPAQGPAAPPPANDRNGDQFISSFVRGEGRDKQVGQAQRLMVLIRTAGRTVPDVKAWLKARYGIDSTKEIKRKDYDAICSMIESSAPLNLMSTPSTPVREPGEEG